MEIYDAEMEGLTRMAEAVKGLLATTQEARNIKSIHFFADNTGALQRIHKGTPGKAQGCSQHFRPVAFPLLHQNQNLSITLSWVPGHHNTTSNDRSDTLAKQAQNSLPGQNTTQ
jgi:ribonuclease HI